MSHRRFFDTNELGRDGYVSGVAVEKNLSFQLQPYALQPENDCLPFYTG